MTHYSTLGSHVFDADVDDLRGADLYGDGGQKLATIDDVVFEHGTGNIEYLVADVGHGRHVLVPVSAVRLSTANDRDLDSEYSRADLDHLPAFDEKMLKHNEEWENYKKLHKQAMKERGKEGEREYKKGWTDDPVEHMSDDVAHTITPVEVSRPASNVTPINRGRRMEDDYIPDVTPQRLAPVFTSTANTSDKLNMVPNAEHSRGPAADYISAGLGPKWNGYQEQIRRDLPRLRGVCDTCKNDHDRAA